MIPIRFLTTIAAGTFLPEEMAHDTTERDAALNLAWQWPVIQNASP
jgi:hypothetical protein